MFALKLSRLIGPCSSIQLLSAKYLIFFHCDRTFLRALSSTSFFPRATNKWPIPHWANNLWTSKNSWRCAEAEANRASVPLDVMPFILHRSCYLRRLVFWKRVLMNLFGRWTIILHIIAGMNFVFFFTNSIFFFHFVWLLRGSRQYEGYLLSIFREWKTSIDDRRWLLACRWDNRENMPEKKEATTQKYCLVCTQKLYAFLMGPVMVV